ncbi:MAG: TonB-dependent receptor [Nevskiaceae bacterium]|nr:MAG: TonB-dependent receptor [Nevskiaceae bacterium]
MNKLPVLVSLLLAALLPAALRAQAADGPAAQDAVETLPTIPLSQPVTARPPSEPPQAPTQLREVVVTAQKTRQSASRVPLSITALDGEAVKETGAAGLADVSLYIPNARFEAHSPGSPQVYIRGFGTNAFNPSFESSVAFVQDDLYLGRPGYITQPMFDIDRIEVLRGPQGTLFGKNTVAGVFNLTSKSPEEEFSADGSLYYGSHDEKRVEAGAGGMFNDWIGARVAVYGLDRGGRLYNTDLDRYEDANRQRAARFKLRLLPGAGIESELTALTSRTRVPFWPYELFNLSTPTKNYLRSFDPRVEDNPYDFQASFDTPGWMKNGEDTIGLKTHWKIGDVGPIHDFDPVLVLGGSRFTIDQYNELDDSPADLARLNSHERHRQLSAELRFTGHADSLFGLGTGLDMVVGGYYFKSNFDLKSQILAGHDIGSYLLTDDFLKLISGQFNAGLTGGLGLPGIPALGALTSLLTNNDYFQFDYGQKVISRALFGQATWNLTPRWAITPGLRLSIEDKAVDAQGASHCLLKDQGVPRPCVTELLLNSKDYDKPGLHKHEVDVSPKLAVQYFGDHGINYYASYTRGYKSGGFNALSYTGTGLEYQPEKATTVEAGAKAKLLDKRLNLDLTLYQTRFDNLQVLAFNGFNFDVSNAASARSRGLEADFQWLTPYQPLRLNGAFGLLDARYLRYDQAPAPIAQGIGAKQSLAGKRIALAPRSTATLTPTLTYPLGDYFVGSFAFDVIYQGNQYTDTDLDPRTYVGGYTKYAARVILANQGGNWSISLGGTNLSDKRVLNQVIDTAFFPGAYYAQQAAGRELFALLMFRL